MTWPARRRTACEETELVRDIGVGLPTSRIVGVLVKNAGGLRFGVENLPGLPRKVLEMRIPVLRGIIDRRILVNYRVDPEVLEKLLPKPFCPKLINGVGMAGICLIRLKQIRPRFFPSLLGLSSENAAHRIAVEWNQGGERREGVFVPRRDTSSRLNSSVGGKLFPGVHHHARFSVQEEAGHYRIGLDGDDHRTHLTVEGHVAAELPETSVFGSLGAVSDILRAGLVGLLGDGQTGRVRRIGTAVLRLAGRAAGRYAGRVELLRG